MLLKRICPYETSDSSKSPINRFVSPRRDYIISAKTLFSLRGDTTTSSRRDKLIEKDK